jgi:hypothetical protein
MVVNQDRSSECSGPLFLPDNGADLALDPFRLLQPARAIGPVGPLPKQLSVLTCGSVRKLFKDCRPKQPHRPSKSRCLCEHCSNNAPVGMSGPRESASEKTRTRFHNANAGSRLVEHPRSRARVVKRTSLRSQLTRKTCTFFLDMGDLVLTPRPLPARSPLSQQRLFLIAVDGKLGIDA